MVRRETHRGGMSIVEVLLALLLASVAMFPILGLFRSSRGTSEANVETLQAMYLAQKALEQVRREALVRFDDLESVPRPAPLIAEEIKDVCYWFRRIDVFNHNLGNRQVFPYLSRTLRDYKASVEITPYEGMEDLKHCKITIHYPRKAHGRRLTRYVLESLVARRSLF